MAMASQGFNLETLAGLHLDELSRIIKSLQGLTYTRRDAPEHAPSPPAPTPQGQAQVGNQTPTAAVNMDAIKWEQFGYVHVPTPTGTPPPPQTGVTG